MAFVSLFGFIFLPLILLYEVVQLIKWLARTLLLHSVLVNVVVAVLLVVNIGILAALLAIRSQWKKSGKMERSYLRSYKGWSYEWRLLVKLLLILGPVWQGLVILLCVLYLAIQPLRYLTPLV